MRLPALPVPTALLCSVLVCCLGCPRPPIGPPGGGPPPEGRVGPVALEIFTQDRNAIGGKWFEYSPDDHALTPKAEAWIMRDLPTGNYVAFRITSIYEEDAAESGLFTFGIAIYDGAAWGAEQEWVSPRNVKTTGQMCVDLFARAELPCGDDDAWHLRLATFQYFSPLAGIAVLEPGVFVHDSLARVARVDADSLEGLPDPSTLVALADAPPAAWDGTDWSFDALAPDLPVAGMAIGPRFVDDGFIGRADVYWLMTARFDLVRFTVAPVSDGDLDAGLRFTYAVLDADRADWTAPDTLPDSVSVDVAVPPESAGARGDGTWLTFATSDLLTPAVDLADTSWPHAPPKTVDYDVAIERVAPSKGGGVRILLSPASCVVNATQLGLDESLPPVSNQ